MPCCAAYGCSVQPGRGKRLHYFPRDPIRRKLWQRKVRRINWKPNNFSLLCEKHFDETQFESHRADGVRKLKPNAIPTLFVFTSSPSRPTKRKQTEDEPSLGEHFQHDHSYADATTPCPTLPEDQSDSQVDDNVDDDLTDNPSTGGSVSDKAASGQTACGEAACGQTACGEAASGEKACGEAASGETACGEAACGQTACGEAASGETACGEAASGETACGEAASGQTACGEAASGEKACGEAASGEKACGEAASGAPPARDSGSSQITAYENQVKALRKQVCSLQRRLAKERRLKLSVIRQKKCLERNLASVFNPNQVLKLSQSSPRGTKWSADTIKKGLQLKLACGSTGYKLLLSQNQPLPSERTLQRRLKVAPMQPGIQCCV